MLACVCWAAVVILYLIYTQPYKVVKSCFGPSTQADAKAMMKAIVCLFVAICHFINYLRYEDSYE